jgi:hypothetical protein
MKSKCVPKIVAAILLVAAGPAFAGPDGEVYRSRTSGDWGILSTWEINDAGEVWRAATLDDGIPGDGDKATIRAGHTVFVADDTRVKRVVIERAKEGLDAGTLEIVAGASLTLAGGLTMARRPKDMPSARVVFSGSAQHPGVLFTNSTLDIYGDIEVLGPAGGEIRTAKPDMLVCIGRHAVVRATGGPLSIGGTVEMDGRVIADGPYAVSLDGESLGRGSSGTWQLRHPGASIRLQTARPISLKSGDFQIEEGTLDVATDFSVGGRVVRKANAAINVQSGRQFEVRGRLVEEKEVRSTRRSER